MNRKVFKLSLILASVLTTSSCNSNREAIIIYATTEDYRTEKAYEELCNAFPNKRIMIQSLSTGNLISRLQSEKNKTTADIILGLEVTNAEMLLESNNQLFEDLSEYDTTKYLDEVLNYKNRHNFYHIFDREAGSIILNTKVLEENGLKEPQSYQDLLKPEYKNLIMMPNPKSSGTGYYFYKNLVNILGVEEGLKYFESLSNNVKEFSTSGSGPVKSLDRGEIAIGLGMTFQAAKYVTGNDDLKIKYFNEGSPYTYYTMSVINGRFEKEGVKEIYDFLYNDFVFLDKKLYAPDKIYKDPYQPITTLENFPTDIKYADMGDLYDYKLKQDLLDKWKW